MKRNALIFCFGVIVCLCDASNADMVQWSVADGGNGHYYEVVFAPRISWAAARDDAASRAVQGVAGHLLTVTSEAENDFLGASLDFGSNPERFWLGARQDTSAPDYREPDGGWTWITGEEWAWTNWHPIEPNDDRTFGNETFVVMGGYYSDLLWIDIPHYLPGITGYVVEYSVPATVPVPSSLLLGCIGLAAARWRLKGQKKS